MLDEVAWLYNLRGNEYVKTDMPLKPLNSFQHSV